MLIFLLIFSVSSLDYSDCALITCEQSPIQNNYCIAYDESGPSVFLNFIDCEGGCNFTALYQYNDNITWESQECVPPNVTGHPTGHPCTEASNCSSNICTAPTCYGVPEGNYCYDSEACLPGYYCDLNICTETKSEGDSCKIHEECPIGHGCDRGTCRLLFSKDQGSSTSDKKLCKSNFEYNGKCDSLLVYLDGVEMKPPFECDVDQTCTYISKETGNEYASLPCTCAGIQGKGGGYCSFLAEHSDRIVHDNWVYMSYTYSTCGGNWTHTDDPDILYRCGSITDDQYWYFHNLVGRSRYLALYSSGAIDDCAEYFEFFNLTYKMGKYTFGRFLKLTSLVFLFLLT